MSTTDATPAEVMEHALHAATRAPSVHNTQPWRFVVSSGTVELHLDRDRVLPVADPDAREAQLSCGAALFNLSVTLRAADRAAVTDLLPDPSRPDLLAVVRVGGYRLASPELRSLAEAIDRRATNRRPFYDRPIPMAQRLTLSHAAEAEGAQLAVLDTQTLDAFATLLRRADHLQEEDPAFQSELRDWTSHTTHRADGVPPSAGGPRPVGGELLKLREFHHAGQAAQREFEQEPLVVVLSTPGDTVLDRLRAGQAMQRVLLTITSSGLSASFLSQPIEVSYTRAALRALLGGHSRPQTVLRIGWGHPAATTPRRAVSAVTSFPDEPDAREVAT